MTFSKVSQIAVDFDSAVADGNQRIQLSAPSSPQEYQAFISKVPTDRTGESYGALTILLELTDVQVHSGVHLNGNAVLNLAAKSMNVSVADGKLSSKKKKKSDDTSVSDKLSTQVASQKDEIADLKKQIKTLESNAATLTTERDDLQSQIDKVNQEAAKTKAVEDKAKAEAAEKSKSDTDSKDTTKATAKKH